MAVANVLPLHAKCTNVPARSAVEHPCKSLHHLQGCCVFSTTTLLKSAVAGALVMRRRKDRLLMKHARLSCFLTVALALVSFVTISWVVPPLTVAHAQAASPSAQTCIIRTRHREVHQEAGFTLTLALIGGFTRTGAWCKTVGATATLHAAKRLKEELTLLLFRASEPNPVSKGSAGRVMNSRRYLEAIHLFHDSYGWYWAKATFIPAGGGTPQSASTIHSCQATTGRCAPVS